MAAEDDIRATRLLGAGDRIRAEMHLPLAKEQLVEYTPAIILVKERLGEEAFQQAYAEGQAMELAAAIAYCRELE